MTCMKACFLLYMTRLCFNELLITDRQRRNKKVLRRYGDENLIMAKKVCGIFYELMIKLFSSEQAPSYGEFEDAYRNKQLDAIGKCFSAKLQRNLIRH